MLLKLTYLLLWSHLVGCTDCTVTYNLLVVTLASPPQCITRHPAVQHVSQRLSWLEFHTAPGLNIQILNTYLRYFWLSKQPGSATLINQKRCNLLWLELVNARSLCLSDTHSRTHFFTGTSWVKPTELVFVLVLGKLQRQLNITEGLRRGP